VRTKVRAPGVSRTASPTRSSTSAGVPASIATRSVSEAVKSSSPRIARSVMPATSAAQPASAASSSMTSSWMSVESTSSTTNRFARRSRDSRCTATSMPWTFAAATRWARIASTSPANTRNSKDTTG
jgi:hypothetical protein